MARSDDAITAPTDFGTPVGHCPQCGAVVIAGKQGWGCSAWRQGCRFTVSFRTEAGRVLSPIELARHLVPGSWMGSPGVGGRG